MRKKLPLIYFILFLQLITAQTITTFSTGYTSLEGVTIGTNNQVYVSEHDTGKVYGLDVNGTQTEFTTTGGFYANNINYETADLYIAEPFLDKIYVANSTGVATVYLDINDEPNSIAVHNGLVYYSSISKVVRINADLSTTEYTNGFLYAEGLAFDANDNLYVADRSDRKLYKITPTGTKTVVASNIENIRGIAIADDGMVYFTMYKSFPTTNKVMKYDPGANAVSDFVTTNLDKPRHLAIDGLGNMYVTNQGNETVIKIYDASLLPSAPIVSIPDVNFKSYLLANTAINTNGDTEIQVSEANAFTGNIEVSNMSISDLTGIEAFTSLTYLDCSNNQITALDVSNNTALRTLYCGYNQLTAIDVTANIALLRLNCRQNQITSIVTSNNTALESFIFIDNQVAAINVANNTALKTLLGSNNNLTSIDVSANTALRTLWCSNNQLTSLDVSTNTALTQLSCGTNQLSSLNVTTNTALTELICNNNDIPSIDVSTNTVLNRFICSNNLLTSIDLSTNTVLTKLYISNNQITSIDLSTNTLLRELYCSGNKYTTIDLTNNPNFSKLITGFNTFLTSIDFRNGNNTIITNTNNFSTFNSPNLSCIYVDDAAYSTANWTSIDNTTTFLETEAECSALLDVNNNEIGKEKLKIYPNPVQNKLNIQTEALVQEVSIYNMLGKKVLKSNTTTIQVKSLSKGIYLLKVKADNKEQTTLFIKN